MKSQAYPSNRHHPVTTDHDQIRLPRASHLINDPSEGTKVPSSSTSNITCLPLSYLSLSLVIRGFETRPDPNPKQHEPQIPHIYIYFSLSKSKPIKETLF